MRQKTIGIVGGAGPMAGVQLLECVIKQAQASYGCRKDSDFPKIVMVSYPFSDMLKSTCNDSIIRDELETCLFDLRRSGAEIIVIACNTLHAYLSEASDVVNMMVELANEVETTNSAKPLVLCTSTSVRFNLHQKYFECEYPNDTVQRNVDDLIDCIMKGDDQASACDRLATIIAGQANETIILGCTELSLLSYQIKMPDKNILDPLKVVSKKVISLV